MRRSEEHTSELQSLMRNSYAVFCLKKKKQKTTSIQRIQYNISKNYRHQNTDKLIEESNKQLTPIKEYKASITTVIIYRQINCHYVNNINELHARPTYTLTTT